LIYHEEFFSEKKIILKGAVSHVTALKANVDGAVQVLLEEEEVNCDCAFLVPRFRENETKDMYEVSFQGGPR
jgi:hypothetical protein